MELKDQAYKKAEAMTEALKGASANERKTPASYECVQGFNKLLGIAKEAKPDIRLELWPEPLQEYDEAHPEILPSSVTIVEMEAHYRTVMALLGKPHKRARVFST